MCFINFLSLHSSSGERHLLRHFSEITPEWRESLVRSGVSLHEIAEARLISGSKFFPNFCRDFTQLQCRLGAVMQSVPKEIEWDGMRGELLIQFSKDLFPSGIGLDSIVAVTSLNEEERKNLRKRDRDGIPVWVVETTYRPTWTCNAIFRREEGKVSLVTVFPGIMAPPLPGRGTTEKNIDEAALFWERHAFVIAPPIKDC